LQALYPLVQGSFRSPHLAFRGLGKVRTIDENAKFDVAILRAPREVRAAHQKKAVVDDEKLRVVANDGSVKLASPKNGAGMQVRGELAGRRGPRSGVVVRRARVDGNP
jgi:hypothetical protein